MLYHVPSVSVGYCALMRLKIKLTKSGTYSVPSLSIKELRRLSKMKRRRWELTRDEKSIILEAE